MTTNSTSIARRKPSFNYPVRAHCAALALLLSCSAHAATGTLEKIAQSGVMTIGYQLAPPFSYQDDKQRPIGYTIDICMKVVEAIKRETKRSDLTVKYAVVTPVTSFTTLINGEIDLECANTANTSAHRMRAAFTIPTFISVTRLMVRDGSNIRSIYDLNGKTVNTTWGSRGEVIFDELNLNRTLHGSNLITNDFDGSFSIMETDKADAFITDDVLLYSMRAASQNPSKYVVTKDALTLESLSLMFRKDDPAFKKLVDTEVARIITQGEIYPIYRKWFESPIPPKQINLKLPMDYLLRDSFKTPTDWVPVLK